MIRLRTRYAGILLGSLFLAALPIGGCSAENENLLERGEYLMLEARWREAVPVLRAHLLRNPRDPGAHFYLGRAYLVDTLPLLAHAEGELKTALYLFHEQGGQSPIERFDDTYFELACHLELSKVHLAVVQMVMNAGGQRELLERALEQCEEHLDAARSIDPESPDVEQLETLLSDLRGVIDEDAPPRRPEPRQPPPESREPREPPRQRLPGDRFAI